MQSIFQNSYRIFPVLLSTFILVSVLQSAPRSSRGSDTSEKTYLFPGTGFFVKNRKPYEPQEAKKWFNEADGFQKKGDLGKALSLYEKFSKRRSDSQVQVNGESISVGAESLFRAAKIREKRGDWQKAFQHLRLVAQAYTNYDFERIAEALMRLAERLAKEDQPRKWGVIPRFRSGNEDRLRLNQIVDLARGPKFAPRALMALAEIALKDEKEEDAIDGLERLINLYPENYLCEKAYFLMAEIYRGKVAGPAYDQGLTLKALNFYEDFLILYEKPPTMSKHESQESYSDRVKAFQVRRKKAELGRKEMRQILAMSKVEVGEYVENYGKFFMTRWKELGNRPALQYYNEAITSAPESEAARIAEGKVKQLKAGDE